MPSSVSPASLFDAERVGAARRLIRCTTGVGGTVHRITYDPNHPTAVLSASATGGSAPATIFFDASSSSDPHGEPLSFEWDLDGDGAFDDATGPTTFNTYTAAGDYTVKVKVTNPGGSFDVASQLITITNDIPTAVIDSPPGTLTWKVGDQITFSGHGSDPQDGQLPPSQMSWSLILHHCSAPDVCHEHVIQDYPGVGAGSFAAPDHDYPSYLELRLTVTDFSGLQDTASVRLDPQVVDLTFQSSPSGVTLGFGSDSGATPVTRTVIVGSTMSVSAPTSVTIGGTPYVFNSWSDGGAATHLITAGASPTTYAATYKQ